MFLHAGSQSSNEENTQQRDGRSMGEDRDWSWEMNAVDTNKIRSFDKAYIVMKKVPYDVIQKGKKNNQNSYIDILNILNQFACALKREKFLNNF